jgi:ribosomal protein S18 acetylase RimI-like enzyme
MEPADVVLRFLESVGKRSEAEFYISLFRAEPKEQFAAISVDANVARHATEAVVLHLRVLAALGLAPVVLLGLFEPTDSLEHGARIRRRLERAGVPAVMISPSDPVQLAAQCAQATRTGTLPIVAFGSSEGALPEERFARMGALLAELKTRKLIFLHRPGGLRQKGVLVPVVNLSTDVAGLEKSKELSRKERALLGQSRRLVFELVPHKLTVAITSPLNLLRELFTVKGAGTMLRRGARIERKDSYADVDIERMRQLLTSSFGRPPTDAFFSRDVLRLYFEQGYRGAAILVGTPLGAYLTKFAVEREAQGEGIARDLWDAFAAEHPVVFWRARAANPINEWYTKLADGLMRFPEWTVFWKGLAPERIPEAIAWALAQPVDMPTAAE